MKLMSSDVPHPVGASDIDKVDWPAAVSLEDFEIKKESLCQISGKERIAGNLSASQGWKSCSRTSRSSRDKAGDQRGRSDRRAANPGAALLQAEPVEAELRNLLLTEGLNESERKIYALLSVEEAQPINTLVETTGLNSGEVLATLFNLEMKGIVR